MTPPPDKYERLQRFDAERRSPERSSRFSTAVAQNDEG